METIGVTNILETVILVLQLNKDHCKVLKLFIKVSSVKGVISRVNPKLNL